jgi:hypothetical protein
MVLIVDEDSKRATATAQLVRVLGSVPVIASSEPVAARLLRDVDVVIAHASPLAPKVLMAARAFRKVLRVLVHAADALSLHEQQRGLAEVALKSPFTPVALGDVLARAHARRRAWLLEQQQRGEHASFA